MDGGGCTPKCARRERSEVGDARVRRERILVEPGREHRHGRVAREQRAVASAADVVPASEVFELPARSGRDDHLARVRAAERAPDALEGVRVLVGSEQPLVTEDAPAAIPGREANLHAGLPRDGLAMLEEEREVDTIGAVEPLGELSGRARVERVDHPRAVGAGDDGLAAVGTRAPAAREDVQVGERVLEPGDALDTRLPMVGADDDRVALEERLVPPGRRHQLADRRVRTLQGREGRIGARRRARRSRSRGGRRRGSRNRPA